MAIYLGKVSDHASFQYSFLSQSSLDALKTRRIAHYRAMIQALEQDNRNFDRYLRYERKLRKMILSRRYTYKRLEHLMDKVKEMKWYIEEEFGQSGHCVGILPSPEGYAQELWKNARDSALARRSRERYEARRSEMLENIRRGEASHDDFCPGCCHRWTDNDLIEDREYLEEWEDEYRCVLHRTWVCPECGEKMWEEEETW